MSDDTGTLTRGLSESFYELHMIHVYRYINMHEVLSHQY